MESEEDEEKLRQQDSFKQISEQLLRLKEQLDSEPKAVPSLGTSRQVTAHSRQSSDVSKSFQFKAAQLKALVNQTTHHGDRRSRSRDPEITVMSTSSLSAYSHQLPGTAAKNSRYAHLKPSNKHNRQASNLFA